MQKKELNEKILRRDIYNAKKVYLHTVFACLSLLVLFNSQNIFLAILSIFAFWSNIAVINEYTKRAFKIDNGDYLILASTVNEGQVKFNYQGSFITLNKNHLPSFNEKEKILIVLVDGRPVYAYSQNKYNLGKELILKLK